MKKSRKLKLVEPAAVREVRTWRQKVQNGAEKVGWREYIRGLNSQPNVIAKSDAFVMREEPRKYRPK